MEELFLVDRTDEANRFMKARSSITKGSFILKTDPLSVATFSHNRASYCNYCLKLKTSLLKCGKCQKIYYCTQECQKQDWPLHKKECHIFQKVGKKSDKITNQFMLVLRCYIKYQNKQEGFNEKLDDLISNVNKFQESKLQFFEEMAVVIMKYLDMDMDAEAIKFLPFMKDFISKIMVNTFTIYNNDNDTIASALYIPSNFINHSCDPNAVVIYKGRKQCLYALKDIGEHEEITISYCDYIKPFYDRYRFLLENYFFECNCKRCLKDREGCDTTLICQGCKTANIMQYGLEKFSCKQCQKEFSLKEVYDLDARLTQYKAEMGTQPHAERMETYNKTKQIVNEDSAENNEVLEIISRMYVAEEKYEEAYQNDRVLLRKMKKWCIANDPMIGWKYLELAKLASALSKFNKAREYVSKGLVILDKYYLLDEMPDFKELILDIQNNFQYSLNYAALPGFKKKKED